MIGGRDGGCWSGVGSGERGMARGRDEHAETGTTKRRGFPTRVAGTGECSSNDRGGSTSAKGGRGTVKRLTREVGRGGIACFCAVRCVPLVGNLLNVVGEVSFELDALVTARVRCQKHRVRTRENGAYAGRAGPKRISKRRSCLRPSETPSPS